VSRPTAPPAGPVADFLAHLTDRHRSPQTCRTYRWALSAASRELAGGLLHSDTTAVKVWLAGYQAAATRRCYWNAFKSFSKWAVAAGVLASDPTAGIARPPVPRQLPNPCTDDQLHRILAGTTGRVRMWSTIAAYSGARCIEISRLDREHVTERTVALAGKGNKPRRVPTHPAVWRAVRDLPAGPLAGVSAHRVSTLLRQSYVALGVDVTAHQLRHWYGTTLVYSGAGIEEVQSLMGHSSLVTTLGYVLVASPRLAAAVNRLPEMGGGS